MHFRIPDPIGDIRLATEGVRTLTASVRRSASADGDRSFYDRRIISILPVLSRRAGVRAGNGAAASASKYCPDGKEMALGLRSVVSLVAHLPAIAEWKTDEPPPVEQVVTRPAKHDYCQGAWEHCDSGQDNRLGAKGSASRFPQVLNKSAPFDFSGG